MQFSFLLCQFHVGDSGFSWVQWKAFSRHGFAGNWFQHFQQCLENQFRFQDAHCIFTRKCTFSSFNSCPWAVSFKSIVQPWTKPGIGLYLHAVGLFRSTSKALNSVRFLECKLNLFLSSYWQICPQGDILRKCFIILFFFSFFFIYFFYL